MTKPSDHHPERGEPIEKNRFKLRKGAPSRSTFKEVEPGTPGYPKAHYLQRFTDPRDKKNLLFLILSVIVILVISALLELKQIHDAAQEKPPQEQSKTLGQ